MTASVWPLMWPWFKPIAAKRMRGGFGAGSAGAWRAGEAVARDAANAAASDAADVVRNPRRSGRLRSSFLGMAKSSLFYRG